MPKKEETKWSSRIAKEMRQSGAKVMAIVGGLMQEEGVPDYLVIWKGNMWMLEFKGAETRVKDIQRVWMEEANKRRESTCFVIRYPNKISDPDEVATIAFDGTGKGLLTTLSLIFENK